MPGFGDRLADDAALGPDQLRARARRPTAAARRLGPQVEPERPLARRPRLHVRGGPRCPPRSLRDYRGPPHRAAGALHAAGLPARDSSQLAESHQMLAVARRRARSRCPDRRRARRHPPAGPAPAVLFPVVTDGAARSSTPTGCSRTAPARGVPHRSLRATCARSRQARTDRRARHEPAPGRDPAAQRGDGGGAARRRARALMRAVAGGAAREPGPRSSASVAATCGGAGRRGGSSSDLAGARGAAAWRPSASARCAGVVRAVLPERGLDRDHPRRHPRRTCRP